MYNYHLFHSTHPDDLLRKHIGDIEAASLQEFKDKTLVFVKEKLNLEAQSISFHNGDENNVGYIGLPKGNNKIHCFKFGDPQVAWLLKKVDTNSTMSNQAQDLLNWFKQHKTKPDFDDRYGRHLQDAPPTFEAFCVEHNMTMPEFESLKQTDIDFARAIQICEMDLKNQIAGGLITGAYKGQGGIFVAENFTSMRSRGGEKDIAINNNLNAMSDEQLARILGRHDVPTAPINNEGK